MASGRGLSVRRLAGLLFAAVAACTTPRGLYDWPDYEASVHAACTDFEHVDLPKHVEAFVAQVAAIEEKGHVVPPGIHAHLGYLYTLVGDNTSARAELQTERELFPESAVFMDRLLARLDR